MLYPPEWIRNPRRKTAGAAGGCMLIRPEALERAGGVAAIRGEIIDDCALARRVKRSWRQSVAGGDARHLQPACLESFGEIERMIARTAFNQLQHSPWLLIGAMVGLLVIYLLPLVLLLSGSRMLALLGAAAYLLMWVTYAPMVRFYGLNGHVGTDAALQRCVLSGRDYALGAQVLVRPWWRVEGQGTGPR